MPEITGKLTSALADRYAIERELGAGGMATVYLAEDLKDPTSATSQASRTLPVSRNAARKALCCGFPGRILTNCGRLKRSLRQRSGLSRNKESPGGNPSRPLKVRRSTI